MKRSGSEGRWGDIPSPRTRFTFEAAFLILVAVGAALAQLSPQAIIVLMLVAWLLVALIERASSRAQAVAPAEGDEFAPAPAATADEPLVATQPREVSRWNFWRRGGEAALASPTAPLEERPSRAHVRRIEPEAPPAVELESDATEIVAAPEPVAQAPSVTKRPLDLPGLEEPEAPPQVAPPPVEERPAEPPVAPVPPPPRIEAPPPTPVQPPPPTPPAPRPPPQEWNLWDLERRARERAGDALRDEEWSALFIHLRQFASAEGTLPKEFDDLVRESFSELIQAA